MRILFDEGVAFVDQRRWEDAEARFRECLAIRRSPVIEYNLASALEAQGEVAEASLLLARILSKPDVPPALRRASEALLARIEPRLAYLTVRITGALDGTSLRVDGAEVAPERIGERMAVDPGPHRVEVRSDAGESIEEVEAAAGESLTVQIAVPVTSPVALARDEVARDAAPDEPEEAPRGRRRRPWLWISLAGVAAAGAATTTVLLVDRAEPPTRGTLPPFVVTVMVAP